MVRSSWRVPAPARFLSVPGRTPGHASAAPASGAAPSRPLRGRAAPGRGSRSAAVAVLVAALALTGSLAAPGGGVGGAAPLRTAAVIVETGAATYRTVIRFATESISGVEALQLAGADPVTYGFGTQGIAVCALYGVGRPSGPGCLGGADGDPRYWAYFRSVAGTDRFTYSSVGAGATRVRDGDVEGWRWGTGQAPTHVPLSRLVTPAVSVGDVTVPEGDGDARAARVAITLSRPLPTDATVVVSTEDGTASAGVDYRARTGRVHTVRAGRVRTTVSVPILGNSTAQPNRSFRVTLSSPSVGVNLGRATGTVTILDDDAHPSDSLVVGDARLVRSEEPATVATVRVPVARRGPATGPASVTVTVGGGSAVPGTDVLVSPPRVLDFEPGRWVRWVTLRVPASGLVTDRTVGLVLSAPSGATIARGSGTLTISGRT